MRCERIVPARLGAGRWSRRELCRAGGSALALALLAPLGRPAHAYSVEAPARPGRIEGQVRYGGRAPRPAKAVLSGDCAYCKRFDIRVESLLVSPRGGLRNVVVALEKIERGKALPAKPPVLAEKRCAFVPHVLSVTAGSTIVLHNQDPVLNTFHAVAQASGRTLFNVGTPLQGQKVERRVRQAGVIQVRCDVHPWEEGYIVAFSHPYHAVTDASGAFLLEQVPPGRHTLTFWHERLGVRRETVEVPADGEVRLEVTYPAASR